MYFHYVMKNVIVHLWRLNPLWVCSRHRICSYISASGKAPFHQHEEKLYTGTEFNAKQSFVFLFFYTLMDFVSEDYCEAHRQDLNGLMPGGGGGVVSRILFITH